MHSASGRPPRIITIIQRKGGEVGGVESLINILLTARREEGQRGGHLYRPRRINGKTRPSIYLPYTVFFREFLINVIKPTKEQSSTNGG